jgi:hypothetical protein
MKKEEKEQISLEMGLAVLISKNIYNFSELVIDRKRKKAIV